MHLLSVNCSFRLFIVDQFHIIIGLSALTDFLDGQIARRCNKVSDLGKLLDPIADKVTQGVMLICLIKRFPAM